MNVSGGTETDVRAGRREWIGLAVLGLPTILIALDMSVLYLALPHVASDLGASSVQQLWITDIYGFLLAGLLVTMGTVGDRIGRRKLLLIGGACFAAASVLAAYSQSPEMLIATRALLGIAGSTVMPSTMSLISSMFTNPKQHATALSVWMVCFMGGVALGPIIGGALLEAFWWGAAFLLGVPVMLVLLVLAPRFLPEYRNPGAGRIDLFSVALSLLAILPLVYGLKQLTRGGGTVVAILAIAVGLAAGITFVRRQNRLESPLLDLKLFRNGTFTTALLLTTFAGLISANQLFVSLYLQTVQQLTPVQTALWLLPGAISMILLIQLAPVLIQRIKPAYVIAGGLIVAAVGYLMLTQVGSSTDDLGLTITALVVANLGIGPMAGLCAVLAMQSAPPEHIGAAASLTETSGEFGLAMGVATVGVVGFSLYRSAVEIPASTPDTVADAARESAAGAISVADQLPPADAASLLTSAYQATTSSLHISAAICAGLVVVCAVMVSVGLRRIPAANAAATPQEASEPASS
ncbi:DHA2 family multidrug resistance protein-like MFS transporter [Actinokineospora baliensis]|uniref:MFS transporter n=1 Tax=Actinokineospora baliensis TaxID=547056 RepID=UPI0019594352|nr:MFS transporter [Actinokineospora baliensis]MBM7774564.1 DHA2 family multidrug resistance protein-like MFS transporter [Actinokineospora baliensis]